MATGCLSLLASRLGSGRSYVSAYDGFVVLAASNGSTSSRRATQYFGLIRQLRSALVADFISRISANFYRRCRLQPPPLFAPPSGGHFPRGHPRSRASGAENRTRRECRPRSRPQEHSRLRESSQRPARSLNQSRADLRRAIHGPDAHGEGIPQGIGLEAIEGEARLIGESLY